MKPAASLPLREPTFQRFLQRTLELRAQQDSSYSLRQFARDLAIHPTSLSQILSGKRSISNHLLLRLALKLEVDLKTCETFQKRNQPARPVSPKVLRVLPLDSFSAIADWQHFAILELTRLKGFKSDITWISKKLSLPILVTRAAVERLFRLGMLAETQSGKWIDASGDLSTGAGLYTSQAHRRLQSQILEQAKQALDQVPVKYRDQSALTMAISTQDLELARAKITAFRKQMIRLFEKKAGAADAVYQFSISLFPVSEIPTSHGVKK